MGNKLIFKIYMSASAIEALTQPHQFISLLSDQVKTPESHKHKKTPFKNSSNFSHLSGTKVKEQRKWGCQCMDQEVLDSVKIVDHL